MASVSSKEKWNTGTPEEHTASKELLNPTKKSNLPSLLKELGPTRKPKDKKVTSLKTFRVGPSSVMSRLEQLLPVMQEADQILQQRLTGKGGGEDLNIESVEEGKPCIEMDMVVVPLDNSSSSTDEDAGENSEHASLDDTRDTQSKVLWRHSPDDGEPSDAEDTELLSARASSKTTLIEEVS